MLWTQRQSHLRVYKEFITPAFCFRAKKADEWAGELWSDKLFKEPTAWPYWLCIAHLFLLDWCIANLFHQTCKVPSMNLAITSNNGPRQWDLPTSTFSLYHFWSKTLQRRGGCTNTTNTMYKIHKILHLRVQQSKAIQLLEVWRGGWYNQSIPIVIAGDIISTYLWLPLMG